MIEKIHCFINEDYPIIATASRADLSDVAVLESKRYPMVHAIIRIRDTNDDKKELYVEMDQIVSIPSGQPLDYKCPYVEKVTTELMKFVNDMYPVNRFRFKINDEFFTVADMSGTIFDKKYVIMPGL